MRKITLKQLANGAITDPVKFVASPARFRKIARSLDNTDIKWNSGCKATGYGMTDNNFSHYYITRNVSNGLSLTRGSDVQLFKASNLDRVSIR